MAEGFRAFFAFIAAEPGMFAFLERNAEAVMPLALQELGRTSRSGWRPASTGSTARTRWSPSASRSGRWRSSAQAQRLFRGLR